MTDQSKSPRDAASLRDTILDTLMTGQGLQKLTLTDEAFRVEHIPARDAFSDVAALYDTIDRLTAALDARGWKPIDTAPTSAGARMMGFCKALGWFPMRRELDGRFVMTDGSKGDPIIESDDLDLRFVAPTHWMPLPSAEGLE